MNAEVIIQIPMQDAQSAHSGAGTATATCGYCLGVAETYSNGIFVGHDGGCPAVVACWHCDSTVRLRGFRFRVIHTAACPWFEPGKHGAVPCGYTVTHRGPYMRESV